MGDNSKSGTFLTMLFDRPRNRTCDPRPERQKVADGQLKFLRKKYHISQRELAEFLCVSRQTISNAERGKPILPRTAMLLAEYFGLRDWRILLPREFTLDEDVEMADGER